MPVKVKKVGKKYRIVDADGKVEKTPGGAARDGGGHSTKAMATRQAQAMNIAYAKKIGKLK